MKLVKARVKGYRSIKDTGYFDLERTKTIFVGPNESGKTAIFRALHKLNPSSETAPFHPLRDYPRSDYDRDIARKGVDTSSFTVVEGHFSLDESDLAMLPPGYQNAKYVVGRRLDNSRWHRIDDGPEQLAFGAIETDMARFSSHIDVNFRKDNPSVQEENIPSEELIQILGPVQSGDKIYSELAKRILGWIKKNLVYVDEGGPEEERYERLKRLLSDVEQGDKALRICSSLLPSFVLFSDYLKVRPVIHLGKFAERVEKDLLDDHEYDYGNLCLLKFLGFTPRELSIAGELSKVEIDDPEEMREYMDLLDDRKYRLNAASIRLTEEINEIWNPDLNRPEASKLEIDVDGQYLKVVVKDELGVEVELDQRSEGFQWTFSFLVVFFAEAEGRHKNCILLLDEPGTSLHALKQAEFRNTISKLSEKNQSLFTTHSSFMIGPNEIDRVRVVEMLDRESGTTVCAPELARDYAALLPIQEALGYEIAQAMFGNGKNLLVESMIDYWYIDTISDMMRQARVSSLGEDVSIMPVASTGRIAYMATVMHSRNLKVTALSDCSTESNIRDQNRLVTALGARNIMRSLDFVDSEMGSATIEDMMRETIASVAKEIGWDVDEYVSSMKETPILDILDDRLGDEFSRSKLARAFMHRARSKIDSFSMLTPDEQKRFKDMFAEINATFEE